MQGNVPSRARSFDNIFSLPTEIVFSFSSFSPRSFPRLYRTDSYTRSISLSLSLNSAHVDYIFSKRTRYPFLDISIEERANIIMMKESKEGGNTFAAKFLIRVCQPQTIRQITLSRWIKLLQKAHILQNVSIKYLPWNGRVRLGPRGTRHEVIASPCATAEK